MSVLVDYAVVNPLQDESDVTVITIEDDGSEYVRLCLECGIVLDDDYPYELCEECQNTKTCHHGTPYREVCEDCCRESDYAFDARR